MKFNILTIFPDIIDSYISESILSRAQNDGHISVDIINIRDFTNDKHNKVDAPPYGGGSGMIMKPEPIYRALKSVNSLSETTDKNINPTYLMSPDGDKFTQDKAEDFSKLKEITLVCGRYEGVDQRVSDYMVDGELSIGPYVLSGGELPALVILESIARLIPGVLGNSNSLENETEFNKHKKEKGCYPQYTRPREFKEWEVPDVLLSGDHQKIREWRESNRENYS